MTFTYSFGPNPNKLYGIELSILSADLVDLETHYWEWLSFKVLFKLFGLYIFLFGLGISKDRVCISFCNCFLAVFYG